MDAVRVDIAGERQVELLFEEFPDALYADLLRDVHALTDELLARIESATPVRTGRLRGEERSRVFADPRSIAGRVTVAGDKKDVAKAAALEYGAHRTTHVSAYQRRLDHVFGNALSAPMMVMVDAYSRTPDVQEVAFERGPLEAMAPEIFERLNATVETAIGGANA